MTSLAGKHIVVTGGGTGVGAATAQAFASAGATVTIMGRSEAPLVAQGLPYETCDVTDRDAVFAAFEAARSARGPVTVVVANAGAAESVPFAKMTPDMFNSMLAVNLGGVVNCWQAALADMKAEGWGRMIAVASTAGLKGFAYVSADCPDKHDLNWTLHEAAKIGDRKKKKKKKKKPGYIETPMLQRSIDNIIAKTGMSAEQAAAQLRAGNPQDRFIQPDEVAGSALWLCSDAARSVNGHALSLTGGEI